jgi:N-acetylglucosaminyldiphosphoundecaprenol N-acetyl-beta-D-mannosaminyltransferase
MANWSSGYIAMPTRVQIASADLVDLAIECFTVGGINISCVDREQAIDHFFRLVASKCGGIITSTGAHGIVESQTDPRLREIINAARMTLPDGTPVEWVGKLKHAAVQRVHGHDFLEGVMNDPRAAAMRHYFYGGRPEVLSSVVDRATRMLGLGAVVGAYSPPFRPLGAPEDPAVVVQIAATKPDVIWVGLSCPKQEYWSANYVDHFPGAMLVAIGAAFDLFAGVHVRAPKIVQRVGLEWLIRLLQEPTRLWPRYSRVVPKMLMILASEAMQHQNRRPNNSKNAYL